MELNKPDNAKYKTKLGIIVGIPICKVPMATNRIRVPNFQLVMSTIRKTELRIIEGVRVRKVPTATNRIRVPTVTSTILLKKRLHVFSRNSSQEEKLTPYWKLQPEHGET